MLASSQRGGQPLATRSTTDEQPGTRCSANLGAAAAPRRPPMGTTFEPRRFAPDVEHPDGRRRTARRGPCRGALRRQRAERHAVVRRLAPYYE